MRDRERSPPSDRYGEVSPTTDHGDSGCYSGEDDGDACWADLVAELQPTPPGRTPGEDSGGVARPAKRARTAGQEPPPSPGEPAAPAGEGPMEALPDDLLRHILGWLSAEALASVRQTSRRLRAVGGEDPLWRRLAHARWGEDTHRGGMWEGSWQQLYRHLDTAAGGEPGGRPRPFEGPARPPHPPAPA